MGAEIDKPFVNLHIGGYYASRSPTVISTVLGSCVAVCLHDPIDNIGGMNHILLPGKAEFTSFNNAARYGINAMELLINAMMQMGCRRSRLKAKLFGGAHLLAAISVERGPGKKNIDFVENFLSTEGIPVLARETGGFDSRKIYFHTDTGMVLVRRTQPAVNSTLGVAERQWQRRIREKSRCVPGFTLFRHGKKDLHRK